MLAVAVEVERGAYSSGTESDAQEREVPHVVHDSAV